VFTGSFEVARQPLLSLKGTAFHSLWITARHSAPGGTAFRSRWHGIPLPVARHSAPGQKIKSTKKLSSDNHLEAHPKVSNLL
jgi:hypothetical protein